MKYPQLVSMPSKVSDWLEEQLEARGIDAVVYTRYILSLFHSDTVDVICPDEDLHFSHLKREVRRSGGSNKRFRRSSEWWRHGEAEAEKLRRSAAVECLMSASEQTSGIETLVDELCVKLKEVDSDVPSEAPLSKKNLELQRASPQELANRYYAAFPPLTRNSTTSPSSLITLIPKWIPSPKRKNIAASSAVSRKHNNRSYEDKFHCRMDTENMKPRNAGKSRFGYIFSRNKKELSRNVAKSVECLDPLNLCLFANNVAATTNCPDWPKNDENLKVETDKEADHCMGSNEFKIEEDFNMYDDIPVDIKELLDDSPTHQDDNVDQMNVANMRDTGKRGFVQYGLTSSIWSTGTAINEDYYGQAYKNFEPSESILDLKFKSISIDAPQTGKNDLDSINSSVENDNNRNTVVESIKKNSFVTDPWNYQTFNEKWSEDSGCFDEEFDSYKVALSLIKLNHNKEASPFVEVPQRSKAFASFGVGSGGNSGINKDGSLRMIDLENDKEDLLTSITSHFRPIKEHVENSVRGEYADGATFSSTTNTFEKVNYRRTESGAMYLESDYTMRKKYVEYKADSQPRLPFGLVLKFTVSANDKSCQTDNADDFFELVNTSTIGRGIIGEDSNGVMVPCKCTCPTNLTTAMNKDYDISYRCPVHPFRLNAEKIWNQYQPACKICSAVRWNSTWVNNCLQDEPMWNGKNMADIWNGNEVCHDCLGRPPSTEQHTKLREELYELGDQLLSDLNTAVQMSFMNELPAGESTLDIDQMIMPKERKRRHSVIATAPAEDSDIWSFTSRLEEDCLIQMSTMPTLRSVTL